MGDWLAIGFATPLTSGDVATGVSNTFTDSQLNFAALPGPLTPAGVYADLQLAWGTNGNNSVGTVQSSGAIPEPSAYAALIGSGLGLLMIVRCIRGRRRCV